MIDPSQQAGTEHMRLCVTVREWHSLSMLLYFLTTAVPCIWLPGYVQRPHEFVERSASSSIPRTAFAEIFEYDVF